MPAPSNPRRTASPLTLLLLLLTLPLTAEPARAPAQPASGAGIAGAKVSDLGFLSGSWHELSDSGAMEEHWSTPHKGNMTGLFRWLRADGQPQLFELLTISSENDEIVLRIRHLTPPNLAHWEREAERPATLRLRELAGRKAVFEATGDTSDLETAVYDAGESGALRITLTFRASAGRKPLDFSLKQGPLPAGR